MGNTDKTQFSNEPEEAPPILKSWRNLYLVVLANLFFWIMLLTFFTWMF